MKHFHAATVERRKIYKGDFQSQPMEAGWATEAIFFLLVEEVNGVDAELAAVIEISADGINWIPEGSAFPAIRSTGHYFVKVNHFGNWLRVNAVIKGEDSEVKVSVHLHLKE